MRNKFISSISLMLSVVLLAGFTFGQKSSLSEPTRKSLLNKLPVLIWRTPGSQKVSISLRIHSGAEFDQIDREGTMKMVTMVMFPDNGQYEDFEENLGGKLSVRSGFDFIQIDASADADKLVDVLEIISAAITTTNFSKEATAEAKKELTKQADMDSETASKVADSATMERLYGDFPYGRNPNGTTETLEKIDFADLIFAKERFFTADNATLAIVGDVQTQYAYRAARRLFGSWNKSNRIIPSNFTLPGAPEIGPLLVNVDEGNAIQQRYAVEAFRRNAPEYFSAKVLTKVLQMRLEAAGKKQNLALNSHYLRGYILFDEEIALDNVSRTDGPDESEINPLALHLATTITPVEFLHAKLWVKNEFLTRKPAELWFEVTTYKLDSVKSELAKIEAVTVDSVNKAAKAIAANKMVNVSVVPLEDPVEKPIKEETVPPVLPKNDNDPDDPR